jgi:hypothetical protein
LTIKFTRNISRWSFVVGRQSETGLDDHDSFFAARTWTAGRLK